MSHAQGIVRNLSAIIRVPGHDLRSVCSMTLTALFLPLLTRSMSLPSMVAFLDTRSSPPPGGDPRHVYDLAEKILARNIGPFRPGCYRRSLMLFRELRRRGWGVRIVFGIREEKGSLDGHAWIEIDGQALGEAGDPAEAFSIAFAYPETSSREESSS